jgi:hypothetical protein
MSTNRAALPRQPINAAAESLKRALRWVGLVMAGFIVLVLLAVTGLLAALFAVVTFLAMNGDAVNLPYGSFSGGTFVAFLLMLMFGACARGLAAVVSGIVDRPRCPSCRRWMLDDAHLQAHAADRHETDVSTLKAQAEARRQEEIEERAAAYREQFRCPECNRLLSSDNGLNQHIAAKHSPGVA